MPCSIFIPIKGPAFTPAPVRKASCCARMLPPPNVTRKAHSGRASGAPLAAIEAQPCVASSSPAVSPAAAPSEPAAARGNERSRSSGTDMCSSESACISTEKKAMNPPTHSTVSTPLCTDAARMPSVSGCGAAVLLRLFSDAGVAVVCGAAVLFCTRRVCGGIVFFSPACGAGAFCPACIFPFFRRFAKYNARYTPMTASRCAASKTAPAAALPNIAPPTLPTRNIGPEVEQSTLMRFACSRVIAPPLYRSATVRLPTGYPESRLTSRQ